MRRVDRRRGGFTLIEIMIALGILVVGMSSIMGLLTFGMALQRTSGKRAETHRALEGIAATITSRLFAGPEDAAAKIEKEPVPGHPGLVHSVSLTENPELPGEFLAEIDFQWKEKGRYRTQTFRTIVLREIPFADRMRKP